ncbi:calcium-binding protein [Lutimaribacter marinistellae]|uniref:Calcium-binding protein n=1 Tax=Lutimaribacter marinistellae TaxID=1820329 RepID=A0ABV7TIJ7_9RHOB
MSEWEIRIEAQPVYLFGDTGNDHLYLVLVSPEQDEWVLRGYPSGIFNVGPIIVEDSVPIADSRDYRPIEDRERVGSRVLDLEGRDPLAVWDIMRQQTRAIEAAEIAYDVFSMNSNSAVASMLHTVGLRIADNLPDQPDREDSFPGIDSILDVFDFVLSGADDNDVIWGGSQNDTLSGGADDDSLSGQAGRDHLMGGDGADFLNGGWGSHDQLTGGNGADRFFHAGHAGHGTDWILDADFSEGDRLVFGSVASADHFQVNIANTAGMGDAEVAEAFVIWKPTGQILWALTDGAELEMITIRAEGSEFDLVI